MSQNYSNIGLTGYVPNYNVAFGNTISPFVLSGAAPGVAGTVLGSNGVAANPSFQTIGSLGAVTTLTGDTGGALSPTAGNFNLLGSGSITVTGAGSTLTHALTGLTNHSVLVGAGTSTITKLAVGTNGQVLLGSTGADPVFSTLTSSDSSVSFTIGAGTLSLQVAGGTTVVKTITGNTGGALSPTAGNFNILGTGSITVAGAGSTETVQLTGLTNHAIQIGAGTATLTQLAATATTGQVLQNNNGADPSYSTATYPSTTTANQILFSSATNVVGGDADLTYIPSTDTFNTSNARLKGPNPWCDVLAYGADPTGVADSTTAFTNAIAAIPLGGVVWVPTGTYKITSTITITTPHVRYCGQSRTDSILNWAGSASGTMFVCNQWYQGFENLTFTTASNTQTAGYFIDMQDTYDYNYVWRCDFTNGWGGIKMSGHLCYIDDVQFRTFSNAAANGNWVLITASHDRWISKVVGDNGSNLTGFAGIRLINTASLLMRDCSLIHGTSAMSIEPTVGLTAPSIEVINTFFDTSTTGLSVTGAGTPARSKFTNCWFSSHTADGVTLNNANIQGFTFVNCDFYGNANGINALAATDWCVMDSRFAGNTTTGIKTTAAATHSFMILGNTIGTTGVFGVNAAAFNIQAGTYASYKIKDNIGLENNTAKGLVDSGVVANQNQKDVSDNLGALQKGGISATTANSGAINTTETIVAGGLAINGDTAVIPANTLQIGTTFRVTMFGTCTSTAANVSTFTLRMGTAGTTADASVATAATSVAATSGTTIGFCATMVFTVRTIGATGTIDGFMTLGNTGITGISANNHQTILLTTSATLNTTTANYIEVTYKSAATTTTSTFHNGIVEIIQCS